MQSRRLHHLPDGVARHVDLRFPPTVTRRHGVRIRFGARPVSVIPGCMLIELSGSRVLAGFGPGGLPRSTLRFGALVHVSDDLHRDVRHELGRARLFTVTHGRGAVESNVDILQGKEFTCAPLQRVEAISQHALSIEPASPARLIRGARIEAVADHIEERRSTVVASL